MTDDKVAAWERERPESFLKHATVATSQYDAQYRSMAAEILYLRELVGAAETPPRPDRLDVEPIKARLDATTKGPWTHASDRLGDPQVFIEDDFPGRALIVSEVNQKEAWGNAAFIAHARQDIPALIAEVEHLRSERPIAYAQYHALQAEIERLRAVGPRPEVEIREAFSRLMASNFRWIPTLCGACGVTYHLCRVCGHGQKGNHRLFPGEDFQCQHTHDDDEPCVESRCQVAKLEAALQAVGVPAGEKK